jgi:gas vesicle protein
MSERGYDEDGGAVEFIAGIIVGGLIGAGTALLLAPRSGRHTRRRLRRAAEDLGDRAEEGLQRAADDVRRVAGDARRVAERSGDEVKKRVERSGEQVRRGVRKGRERLNL